MVMRASLTCKLTLLAAVVASTFAFPFPAADPVPAKLRRIPRIYNALITTDEELLPSQAYPAVAPVLRPYAPYAPYAPYPYAPVSPFALPPIQDPHGVYTPDPYGRQSYSRIPGFNDTLQDPNPNPEGLPGNSPLYTLQARQTVPQFSDHIKNNRPSNNIPDVPPPPLPLSRPRGRDDKSPERKPEDYPPAPSQGLPF